MLFTGKGDKGTTKLFDSASGQRVSKNSSITEALGSLDECNSFLGLAKVKAKEAGFTAGEGNVSLYEIVHRVQENLFIIQAELAGAPKTIPENMLRDAEKLIADIEKELPPITTFFISGGTELAATFDFARTLARRAERRVVAVVEKEERQMGEWSLAYLNRLSSILYALARLSNHKSGIKEQPPSYT